MIHPMRTGKVTIWRLCLGFFIRWSPHEGLLFLRTAKEIWDTVQEMYSQRNSLARNYQLHREIATMQQGKMSMEEYYAALKKKWAKLDHYQPLATTVEGIRKQNEQRRIFEYLAGLRSEYELQRVQVLGKDTWPSLESVYNSISGWSKSSCYEWWF